MKNNPSPTKTRELVIQTLYQKNLTGDSNTKVLKELKQNQKNLNTEKVSQIVKDIKDLKKEFTETIEKFSNIPSSRIGEIELSILYLALYEISFDKEFGLPILSFWLAKDYFSLNFSRVSKTLRADIANSAPLYAALSIASASLLVVSKPKIIGVFFFKDVSKTLSLIL